MDDGRCRDLKIFVNIPRAEDRLALRCLVATNTLLKRDIVDIKDASLLNNEVVDLEARVAEAIPTHLEYSCLNGLSHLASARRADPCLKDALDAFANCSLL